MGIYGTSIKTPFVLTPSGSRRVKGKALVKEGPSERDIPYELLPRGARFAACLAGRPYVYYIYIYIYTYIFIQSYSIIW